MAYAQSIAFNQLSITSDLDDPLRRGLWRVEFVKLGKRHGQNNSRFLHCGGKCAAFGRNDET
jgi:hypothetical protein